MIELRHKKHAGHFDIVTEYGVYFVHENDQHTQPLLDLMRGNDEKAKEDFEALVTQNKSVEIAVRRHLNWPDPEPEKTEAEIADEKAKEFAALMASGKYEDAFYVQNGLEKPKEDEVITPKG